MKIPRDPSFDDEARRFALRFTCEDCAHHDARADACAHRWPDALHRRARYERAPEPGDEIVFCKEFELA